VRVAVVASAQIFGGFQNLPPPQSLDFSAFFGLSHLFPPRLSISVIFDTDLVTSHLTTFRSRQALPALHAERSDAISKIGAAIGTIFHIQHSFGQYSAFMPGFTTH